jgi:molecular chaperone DnaK
MPGVTWDNLDKVLVVGGASRMVMVREMLAELTGMEPDTGLDADLAVASGAALQAAKLRKDAAEENRTASAMQQIEHQNVNSHSLGVEAWNEELGAMANLILIAKNSGLPCERVEQFATDRRVEGDSADLHFRILEGESPDPDACVPIGECRIEDLPQGIGAGLAGRDHLLLLRGREDPCFGGRAPGGVDRNRVDCQAARAQS